MFHNITKYSYDDITIRPAFVSEISHRSECNPLLDNGYMPIFASPMSTVVDKENYSLFKNNNIIPILPRTLEYSLEERIDFAEDGNWAAFSLQEFQDTFVNDKCKLVLETPCKVLIDIANGHMDVLFNSVKKAKEIYGDMLIVMIGNIANPETYRKCYECKADYCRIGIGNGFGCLTSSQLGINYPIASLINEAYEMKIRIASIVADDEGKNYYEVKDKLPKIVADGGIRGYRDVIKALALGADYVMIGSEFAKLVESAALMYLKERTMTAPSNEALNKYRNNVRKLKNGFYFGNNNNISSNAYIGTELYKEFYGMASRQGQIDMNGEKTKTSEGVCKEVKVSTNIDKWSQNMKDYLRSAMSYLNITDVKNINPSNVETYRLSDNAKNSINK